MKKFISSLLATSLVLATAPVFGQDYDNPKPEQNNFIAQVEADGVDDTNGSGAAGGVGMHTAIGVGIIAAGTAVALMVQDNTNSHAH
ncbi:MAG: hypothetical protein ACQEP8_02765 [Chlamydiota bacterium]